MSLYAGLSLRAIYERSCAEHECKKNSSFAKSLPETPDLFTIPTAIDMSHNFLGPKGLRPLLEVVRVCTELRVLNLSDQQMTNESVSELCAVVKDHPSLIHIDLSKNPITIAGGLELVEMLKQNKSLEVLLLDQTEVKPTVMNLIRAQLERNTAAKRGINAVGGGEDAAEAKDATAAITAEEEVKRVEDDLDAPAVRAAFAAIPSTLNYRIFDADPTSAIRTLSADFGGRLFADPQFPADMTSIQKTEANEYGVPTSKKWRRISSAFSMGLVGSGGSGHVGANSNSDSSGGNTGGQLASFAASPAGDIFGPRVGEVVFPHHLSIKKGFAWIWTSLMALMGKGTMSMRDIRSLISPATVNPLGFYVVKVFVDSSWRHVVVDDELPVDVDGNFVFTRPIFVDSAGVPTSPYSASEKGYFWAAIYEKAMAKAYGSYQAIDASVPFSVKHQVLEKPASPALLLRDVSGGVGISRDIQHQHFDSAAWWQTMLSLPIDNTAMVAISTDADESRCAPAGIDSADCFIIQQIRQINGFSLLQLRNPYATRRYCDSWHDGCRNWADYPLIADALGIAKKTDPTTFWIPYHRFLFLFKAVHLCRVFPHYNTRALGGEWTSTTAGGPYFSGHWGANPRYKLFLSERSNVFINLALRDGRFKDAPEEVETLGFHLVRSPFYPLEYRADEVAAKTEYVITNAVSYEGALPGGEYWLIPSSYAPAKVSSFWFRVFSTSPMALSFEPEGRYWAQRSLVCDLASSGEYQNGEDNVQVELRIPPTPAGLETFKVCVVVEAMEPSNDTNVIAFLVKPNPTNLLTVPQSSSSSAGSASASPASLQAISQSSTSNTASSGPAPRRFVGVIPDASVVAKSPFVVGDRVCLEATISVPESMSLREQRYFIIPCITPQKTSAKLNITVFLSTPKFSIENLPLLPRKQARAEWRCSAPFLKAPCGSAGEGGVRICNTSQIAAALSANPQFELCPHGSDAHFIINVEVSGVVDPLIGFAVVANGDNVSEPLMLPCTDTSAAQQQPTTEDSSSSSPSSPCSSAAEANTAHKATQNAPLVTYASISEGQIVAKSRYIRHTSVSAELKLPQGVRAKSYIIVPFLQPAGSSGTCVVTVSNTSPGFVVRNLTV